MLDPKEIAKATKETLEKELKKARIMVAEILLKVRTNQSKANHEAKMWKKYIARMLTKMNGKAANGLEKIEKESENKAPAKKATKKKA